MSLVKCKACGENISENASSCPHCGEPIAKKKKTSIWTWMILLLFIFYVLGEVSTKRGTSIASANATLKEMALEDVRLEYKIKKTASGMILKGDFTVHNNGQNAVKDIKIKCTHFAESGTKIDKNTKTIYSGIGAGSSKTFNDFSMGFIHSQAHDSACEIIDLKVI